MTRVAIALLHHPVLDRSGATVTTSITNLDLHDMARSARSYGASELFVVHPVHAQRLLAERIRDHWVEGSGKKRIPDRATALEILQVVPALEDVYAAFGGRAQLQLWTTGASARSGSIVSYARAREILARSPLPVVIAFGTGWGLADAILEAADLRLEPIRAHNDAGYNHLSVRAACAITLDRLLG